MVGGFAGNAARGNNRAYIDVYATDPNYGAGDATNDRIFLDSDGKLYLGRGTVAPGGAVGGTLRGPWVAAGLTNVPISGVTGLQTALNAKADSETINGSAVVGTAYHRTRYHWSSATNVTLRVSLTGGQYVNLASLRNTSTNAITATASSAAWKWTGGSMTNSIPAGKMVTFGWDVNPITGVTNAYATAASAN
jgi:hypothetical protein